METSNGTRTRLEQQVPEVGESEIPNLKGHGQGDIAEQSGGARLTDPVPVPPPSQENAPAADS